MNILSPLTVFGIWTRQDLIFHLDYKKYYHKKIPVKFTKLQLAIQMNISQYVLLFRPLEPIFHHYLFTKASRLLKACYPVHQFLPALLLLLLILDICTKTFSECISNILTNQFHHLDQFYLCSMDILVT